MAGRNIEDKIRCSFCGKTQDAVERMIAGPGVCICNECGELCLSVLEDEGRYSRPKKNARPEQDISIPKPSEIKEKLAGGEPTKLDDNVTALLELSQGKCDVVLMDEVVARYYASHKNEVK